MALDHLPLLPTATIGSHSIPSWMYAVYDKMAAGEFGEVDAKEAYDDAVDTALRDMEEAELDIVSDGEMRRVGYILSFYDHFAGLRKRDLPRKVGVLAYDSQHHFDAMERVTAPNGLGLREEFAYTMQRTSRPIKVPVPGPLTLATHIEKGVAYSSRRDISYDLCKIINAELRTVVEAGAEYVQIDEVFQVFSMRPEVLVECYNRCVDGVKAKLGLHICFGTLGGFSYSVRTYRPLFPALNDCAAHNLALEFANREMSEAGMWAEVKCDKELTAGVIDLKSFAIETPEQVAQRIRLLLKAVPAEKLYLSPDCGLARIPRYLGKAKLKALVEGAKIVRRELSGKA